MGSSIKSAVSSVTDAVGLTDSKAGDRALSAQTQAADKATALQSKIYEESKGRYGDAISMGADALRSLNSLANTAQGFSLDNFKKDPGYDFRLQEGQNSIEKSAAARGGVNSGATLKALARFGQNFASNEYQNAYNRYNNDLTNNFNRINTIANYGMNANNALSGAGQNFAQNVSNTQMSLGNAAASNEMNRNNHMKDLWQMGMQGAAMFCWVARAVFGENNNKWIQARSYILNIGPKWFRNLYKKHGEKFALKVQKSKMLKIFLAPLFEFFAWRARTISITRGKYGVR